MFRIISHHKKAILFGALLFYLYFRGIGDHGLIDPIEGINASISIHMYAGGNYFVPKIGDSLASGSSLGFWWLCALSVRLFGWGEFAVRFWSALSGLLMILASSIAAKTDSPRSSWQAASVCASMSMCFIVSQLASSHALYSCLVAMAMAWIVRSRENRHWLILSHISITLAFIAHGFEGILLPFLAVIIYSVMSDDYDLLRDFFTWPGGIIITIIFCGAYFVVLAVNNPQIIHFMRCQKYSYTYGGIIGAIVFLFVGFMPYHGFIMRAVYEVFPEDYPAKKSPELFLMVWGLVFFMASILSGDVLAMSACIPAFSALIGRKLVLWLERKTLFSVSVSAMLCFLVIVPVLYILLPFTRKYFPLIDTAIMSLIPWGLLTGLYLVALWYYTKTKQVEKWARNVPAAALLCLMPLAGVFNLAADRYSVRDIGIALRDKISGKDWVIQYSVNYPSVYYYTLRNSVLINSELTEGVEDVKFIARDYVLKTLWERNERVFLIIPEKLNPEAMPKSNIFHITEAEGMLLLSNK